MQPERNMTAMRPDTNYVGRLAPAPTGALHLGNARTFLIAWLRARLAGGRLLLRLEDLDHPKVKPHAAVQAYRDLAWLGLDWNEGPAASYPPCREGGDAADPFVQSGRVGHYEGFLNNLWDRGLAYPCVCTRKELDSVQSAPNAGEDMRENRYPGLCRGRFSSLDEAAGAAGGREPGVRFRVGDGARFSFVDGFAGVRDGGLDEWSGDFLIARGRRAGYQLAVVVDDHEMGVSEVVRGDDLLASTERQLALYNAFGWEAPRFFHVPLVVGPDGRRLAKRHGDTRIGVLRERGAGPGKVLGWLAWSCGWIGELREMDLAEIRETCDFSLLSRSPAVLADADKQWMGFS